MYTQEQIQSYVDDYRVVMGVRKTKFVCPMSLRECELNEIVGGHIVNDALGYSYNETVPVWGRIDNWYGSRIEAPFIEFIRLGRTSGLDLMLAQPQLTVKFEEGGDELKAFIVPDDEVEQKKGQLPVLMLSREGVEFHLGIKTWLGDPRVPGRADAGGAEIGWASKFIPAHCVATMLKVAHLTMFHLIGYKLLKDPCADSVRRLLVQYFQDDMDRKAASTHFRQFANAAKFAAGGTDFNAPNPAMDLDTLRDKKVVRHYQGNVLFAVTMFYKLHDKTLTVTIPQCTNSADIAVATRLYDRLMSEDAEFKPKAVLTRMEPDAWVNEGIIRLTYDPRQLLEIRFGEPEWVNKG